MVGTLCLAMSSVAGQSGFSQQIAPAQRPSAAALPDFSVVSIKRSSDSGQNGALYTNDGLQANGPLIVTIRLAYSRIRSSDEEFVGIPEWARTDRYYIQAKVDPSDVGRYQKLTSAEKALMLQKLLADRFKLKLHQAPKEQSGYDLVVAKGGPKLKPSESGPGVTLLNDHEMKARGYSVTQLAVPLSQIIGRTVQDKTGLQGNYEFVLTWTPQTAGDTADAGPSIFSALEEQLGLRLVPAKHQVMVLVVDQVERPSTN
jgi:uncharacterized protein (TIGR03435 family)